jgi:hypothetical protein
MSKLATMLSVALLLSSASYSAAECPKQTADALAGDGLDTRLTLSLKGSDLGTAFRAVGDATGLSFQLAGLTPAEGPVDLEVANLPARAVLRMLAPREGCRTMRCSRRGRASHGASLADLSVGPTQRPWMGSIG